QLRVQALGAVAAQPVGELRAAALFEVLLEPPPLAAVVADLLALAADRQQAGERAHVGERLLELDDQRLALGLGALALGDVALGAGDAQRAALLVARDDPPARHHPQILAVLATDAVLAGEG